MPQARHVTARDGDVLLMIGTMKGAFLLRSDRRRKRWDIGGPYFPGQSIYALAYDGRADRRRLWAGTQSEHWGASLSSSDDFGRTWKEPDSVPIRFPDGSNDSLKRIWQILPGRETEPDTIYCGVEPAALFRSVDSGKSWQLARALYDHPHRKLWQPGGGGLCLHTIVLDPENLKRMWIAISTGGVYRTDDDGASWRPRNVGVSAEFLPDKYPEFGQCVHKVVSHPTKPDRLFLQNHWGLFRSDDGADSWKAIEKGVPTTFGFAMAMHPHDPSTVYNLPIEADMFRATPEGKLRVYRTTNSGGSWQPLTSGLPQKNAYECVLRDSMAVDRLKPAGVYFGTRSGKVFGSSNEGRRWSMVIDGLPPVTCVKVAQISGAAAKPKRKAAKKAARRPVRKRR